jgi:hypothetical protein
MWLPPPFKAATWPIYTSANFRLCMSQPRPREQGKQAAPPSVGAGGRRPVLRGDYRRGRYRRNTRLLKRHFA